MQEEHDVPMVGHCGEQTMRVVVGKWFYWLVMKEDVKHFVCTCVTDVNAMKFIHLNVHR
jgi:hypothetical protein